MHFDDPVQESATAEKLEKSFMSCMLADLKPAKSDSMDVAAEPSSANTTDTDTNSLTPINTTPSKKSNLIRQVDHRSPSNRKRIRELSITPRKPKKLNKTSTPNKITSEPEKVQESEGIVSHTSKRTLMQACNTKEIPDIDTYKKYPVESPQLAYKLISEGEPQKIWGDGLHVSGTYRVHTIVNNDTSKNGFEKHDIN